MAITSSFLKANGLLTTLGDAFDNTILISRDAAGTIQVNGGAVPVLGCQRQSATLEGDQCRSVGDWTAAAPAKSRSRGQIY